MIPDANSGFSEYCSPWGRATIATISSVVILLVIYHETLFSMVDIWRTSDTFAHCYFIFPISGYLIFRRKGFLADLIPCVDYRPLTILAILGFGWLLANLGDVKVIKQFTLIAMIPVLVWTLLGWKVAKEILFPLLFLLFSVPFGDFLVPRLMDFTADFTVGMLKLTGMPVYREGTFFSIPSGDWSVVEACSGLRYLIASITLGSLFAYFNFKSKVRQIIFVIIATILPVIANGLRAYMIVMIAHLSDMTLAMGVDHFIYGWVFFGIVMALLFWFGANWSDLETSNFSAAKESSQTTQELQGLWREARIWRAAALALAISTIWPARAAFIEKIASIESAPLKLALPQPILPWTIAQPMTDWQPRYIGTSARAQAYYTNGKHTIAIFLEYYRTQQQGKELVSSDNILVSSKDFHWKKSGEKIESINLFNQKINILQGTLLSTQQQLLTWRWNWISGEFTANDYIAKIYHARNLLFGRVTDESGIILAVDIKDDLPAARMALQSFVDSMLPAIEKTLNRAANLEASQ